MKNEDLKKIKKWLPYGYAKIIQERTGKSRALIYQVANGLSYSKNIYDALLDLALENKEEIEKREKLVSTL